MGFARLIRSNKGSVAVEMGLVSPFLLLLFFGISDFGGLLVEAMQVEHATQAGLVFVANRHGSATLNDIQTAVNSSSPLTVTISADPDRSPEPWCGCPNATGTAVDTVDCGSSCATGIGTYFSIIGSAQTNSTLGQWLGFPATLAVKGLVRLS
jgi:hypothetical protein